MDLDRLSAEDERILKLEGGAIRGHTCKVVVLKRPEGRALPTLDALRASIDARLDAAPRLRKRLVMTPLGVAPPVWLDDPRFSIARHVTRVETDGAPSRPKLEQIVSNLMCKRLDRAHPLWHLEVVDLDNDSMALIWRIHHCLADGGTCVALGSAVLWSSDPDPALPHKSAWSPEAAPSRLSLLAFGLAERARRSVGDMWGLKRQRRFGLSHGVVERELIPSATLTPLSHRVGFARNVAFAVAPVDECKQAGKAIDPTITLNDVVLAIVAGGLRSWLSQTAEPMEGIRVQIPVSLHQPGEKDLVSNRDSYFFVDLPVDEPDPRRCVLRINQETTERKLDGDAETLYRLGHHPLAAHWAMSPRVFTFNVSNVRGPQEGIYVLGARVCELYSLAEIAQHHALRVAVISAAGSLFFGLCADRDAVADLDVLADGLSESARALCQLVR
jgi:diacylglycerol O-acyltransferase / wax synthase